MSTRAAFVLGLFVLMASFVHGGLYSAGRDFVVNRFTGHFQFVPAEDEDEESVAPACTRMPRRSRLDLSRTGG